MSNLNQNILDVIKDEKFAKKISELKTPEEVQAAFKEKGVNITLDEVDIIAAAIKQKLEDDAIDSVAGGSIKDWVWTSGTAAEMKTFDTKPEGETSFKGEDGKFYAIKQGTSGHLTTTGKVAAAAGGTSLFVAAGFGLYKGVQDIRNKLKK